MTPMNLRNLLVTILMTVCTLELEFVSMSATNNFQDLNLPSAQCGAICLKKYLKKKDLREECSKACMKTPDICDSHCLGENPGCLDGCTILKEVLKTHPGKCPSSTDNKGEQIRQPSCLSKCKSDSDCFNFLNKCCSVGCSTLCIEPVFNNSIPKIPPQLKPVEIPNSSDIEFEWMSHYKTFMSDKTPLIFILQTRVCPCKFFNSAYVGKWQTLIITGQSGARLNAFDQGKVYQFRLASISPYGTRGYGPASKPFPNKVERPDNPSAPRGLTELLSRLYSSGHISVTIGWQKPEDHALPLSEYVVKWMIDYGYVQSDGQAISALTQFTQSVPPDRLSYVLENLKPNASYRVEVSTKTEWPGDEPLISEPVVLFLSTPAINLEQNDDLFQEDIDSTCKNKTLHHRTRAFSTEISQPIYSNGYIKVNLKINHIQDVPSTYRINWTPKVCIESHDNNLNDERQRSQYIETKDRFVELKDILFSCRYHISVEVINDRSRKLEGDQEVQSHLSLEGYFCVPSCSGLEAYSSTPPLNCYNHKTKLPPRLKHLSSTLLNKNDKTYKLTWNYPDIRVTLKDDIYKSKYRIVWGPRYKEPINDNLYGDVTGLFPIIDSSKTNVKVLNKETTSLILDNLQPQTMYIVKAQLLLTLRDGQEMESDVLSHYFSTDLERPHYEDRSGSKNLFNPNVIMTVFVLSTFSVLYVQICTL